MPLLRKRETFVFYCDPHSNNNEKKQEKQIQTIIEVV